VSSTRITSLHLTNTMSGLADVTRMSGGMVEWGCHLLKILEGWHTAFPRAQYAFQEQRPASSRHSHVSMCIYVSCNLEICAISRLRCTFLESGNCANLEIAQYGCAILRLRAMVQSQDCRNIFACTITSQCSCVNNDVMLLFTRTSHYI